ncbi:MAG: UDP-N-acetylmuramoyl-L-alanyl-D-glutamate--2,6-diaminopimelate ligase [Candidatus Pacebacteria bacterium]|nr:UDP-N-acetylmuramoyl-L-alanyl-D-glutamate--2,6-diaminopimelate ligase [Candidatus Paceibacterota bacterium]MCF7857659.1 UDP-N-acetylmuramoyl-L-alanyl-D-glutamate--2,6-diaminopimelate ligase [Candidatus Paceibacterota bacterium]
MENILYYIRRLIPVTLFRFVQPPYHFFLSFIGALYYRFPSKEITVIGVTGTKGKSTVVELINAILEADGKRTAVAGTIRFKIGEKSERNMYKMTMPGRFFTQRFLRDAVNAGCDVAIVEMTSQGVLQYRHKFIHLDALVFTNLSPEHIESHGSYEKYIAAKLELARALEVSQKRPRYMIANRDDDHGATFLDSKVEYSLPYGLTDLELHTLNKEDISLVFHGTTIRVPLIGLFNVYNTLAAITCARAFSVPLKTITKALTNLSPIKGRVERFKSPKGASRKVTAIVDYAHTPDSLEKLYTAFEKEHKICVLGNTGGGRDTWKRPEMARIAEKYCERIILTNEDPYDEDPAKIIDDMVRGIENESKLTILMDRRNAIHTALEDAPDGSVVIISGKGTDPYIMGPHNTKTPWNDAKVVQQEITALFGDPV